MQPQPIIVEPQPDIVEPQPDIVKPQPFIIIFIGEYTKFSLGQNRRLSEKTVQKKREKMCFLTSIRRHRYAA